MDDRKAAKRVMLVLPWSPAHQGGVTGVVLRLQENLATSGRVVPLLVTANWESRTERLADGAIQIRFSPQPATSIRGLMRCAFSAPSGLYRTWTFLRRHQVHAVNFHYPGMAPLGIAILKTAGMFRGRLVLSYHGTDVRPPVSLVERIMFKFILGSSDAVVACSSSLRDRISETLGIRQDRVSVIGNGADASIFHNKAPRPSDFKFELPRSYVLSVGSFIKRKNHRTTISAFEGISRQDPSLDLVIAGADGEEFGELSTLVDSLNLTKRVHFLRNINQSAVAFLLANCTVCVQSSLAESQPLAVLEAASCGAPLVVSSIPGHIELVENGSTGLRFKVEDIDECRAVLVEALLNSPASLKMAERLRAIVNQNFTWEQCATQYTALYGVVAPQVAMSPDLNAVAVPHTLPGGLA